MYGVLKKFWFLLAVAALAGIGARWANSFETYSRTFDTRWAVIAVMFLNGLTLETARIATSLKRPARVLMAVFFGYLFAALAGYPVAMLFAGSNQDFRLGILIIAAMPTTLASGIIWTRMANGNDALSLVMTVVSNATSFFITPAILGMAVRNGVHLEPVDMMQKLFLAVVLPVGVAQFLRQIPPIARWGTKHKATLSVFAQVLVLNIIFVGIVGGAVAVRQHGDRVSWMALVCLGAAVALVHLLAAAACWMGGKLMRWDRADRLAVVFSGSQKTLPASLYVCREFFPAAPLAPIPCVMYHVCQLLVDSWLVEIAKGRERRRNQPQAEPRLPA